MDRSRLAHHLERARITGEVATPRENNLAHIHRFLAGERQFDFGVELTREWDYESVFALMVDRAGLRPEADYSDGVDTISTDRCLDALELLAAAVGETARAGGRILFATGHPAGLLPVHMALAAAAEDQGANIVRQDSVIPVPDIGGDCREINRVWIWHLHGGTPHTHLGEPMHALLDDLEARDRAVPDLVVADHGWAGAASSRGLRAFGYADCNDPALFVAEAQGQLEATIPLDDDVAPYLYEPMIAFLLDRAGFSRSEPSAALS
ncbi:histidinol phosphate phosphatase hisN-like protein [Brevibacterium sanguinis]|uniref:Histidinol phosphate phosphatase hisN-like protein n=2 Tax=Brevibacterium TaxID=1696 RepID=A0A366ILR8_9MICO|nr:MULTISPECIES: phosphatase [Brevibacterium]RBP64659.1 histidinol phosphate phosphatase hisN-like protein [Brevibacterium sanguinis]RBP71698.1 histidinol phosphate phosphatase hisN-like protein [Brevibacterium celere]